LGRNDLRFYPPNHQGQTIFFTVECKRLRVTTKSHFTHLANKYVEEGIQRFVDGRYSAGLPCGGMVGYVMDTFHSRKREPSCCLTWWVGRMNKPA
jgi:hypothetical protein